MRLTIIRDDSLVGVDGMFRTVALSSLSEIGIRVVQWNGTSGHIEFDSGPNEDITDIEEFQPYIDAWTAAAPPAPTPAELKAAAHARINSAYAVAVNTLTAGYPENEIASWPKQEMEAREWLKDNTKPTPWIDSAADTRGIPKPDFIALVIANADALAPLHGALSGKRQSLRDQIDALGSNPTQEQLDAIQW